MFKTSNQGPNHEKVQIQVYDWPVRFFHWLFAVLFVCAYFIAQVFDDDSIQYPYHMMLGFTLALTVLLRIFWGISGSRFARFNSFELHPKKLLSYAKGLLQKPGKLFLGHNPASSWAAIVMMVCALGLAASGYFMVHGFKEDLEEVHELFANLFLFTAIAHVAGVIFHTIKHKDPIGLSMITGKKFWGQAVPGIQKNFLVLGLLFAFVTIGFGIHLFNNYDKNTMALTVFGQTHQLGKVEKE